MSGGIAGPLVQPVLSSAKPANSGRKLGTLVVVIIKARNLPNKQRIGKQDPYCSVTVGHQKSKTPAVKRGGQTPHWDAQLEFEIWETLGDEVPVVATESGGIAPAGDGTKDDDADLPGQATIGRTRQKSGNGASGSKKKIMKIACYADDPREPELVGEAELDYGATLKKGEFDEWVELKFRGKYAGEVFIEMTFYSSAPPPVKRKSKPAIPGNGYGGPGHFEPLPVTFPQSPARTPQRPSSSTLSPSPALRTSQSSYSLASNSSSVASSSHTVTEFGARPPSQNSAAFPMPHNSYPSDVPHTQSYANNSLSSSSTPSHLAKPHRASFSSYGMTQHDIDSLTRPLSSLSISSVNKPLPQPAGPAGFPEAHHYHATSSPRPTSGQAYSRPPSTQGYQHQAPPPPAPHHHYAPPPLEHHNSQPVTHQQHHYGDPRPDFPQNPHRHSLSTYLPPDQAPGGPTNEPAYSNWNNALIQHLPPDAPEEAAVIGLHRPPSASVGYESPITLGRGDWQDPRRGPSPYQPVPGGSTSPRPVPHHPMALQPGLLSPTTSSGFTQPGPPQPSASPIYHDQQHQYQQPDLQQRYHSPAPPTHQPPPQQYDGYSQPGPPQHQESYVHPDQGYEQHQPYQHTPADQYTQHSQGPYAQHGGAQPEYYQQQPSYHTPPPPPQDSFYPPHQQPEQPYYQQQQPPPQEHYSPAPPPLSPHTQDGYRTSSPYRPLPQPTPDPYHQQQQQHYAGAPQPYYDHQPPAPEPHYAPQQQQQSYQPRFGLPPHQAYDPPYTGGYSAPPPPLPPVPQELRHEENRYNYY